MGHLVETLRQIAAETDSQRLALVAPQMLRALKHIAQDLREAGFPVPPYITEAIEQAEGK